jgi:hypothetical protein
VVVGADEINQLLWGAPGKISNVTFSLDTPPQFPIISRMLERTVLSADVLKCLPNLKLILSTGPKNAAIDIQTCKELGIAVVGASGAGRSDWLSSEDKPPTSLDSTMQHT